MTHRPSRRSVCGVSLDPNDQPGDASPLPGPPDATQEAIDATATVYEGDATLDVEQHLRSELASRGIEPVEDAWVARVAEQVRRGRAPVVGEHDGSVDSAKDPDA